MASRDISFPLITLLVIFGWSRAGGAAPVLTPANLPLRTPGHVPEFHASGNTIRFAGQGSWLLLTVCTPEIIRVQAGPTGEGVPVDGPLISQSHWPRVHYTLDDLGDRLELRTTGLEIDIRKQTLAVDFYTRRSRPLSLDRLGVRWQGGSSSDVRVCSPEEHFYGFGLQFYSFDQRGKNRFLKTNADPRTDTGESHVVAPFFMSTGGYGIFLNSTGYTRFRMASDDPARLSMQAPDPVLDYYFIYGPTFREMVSHYTEITGRMRMPARWGLGFWYRMKSGWPASKVKEVASSFRDHHIPCDVIGLEPSWQTRAYPCSFQWNKTNFPDPGGFVKWMAEQGFHLNLWEHAYTAPSSSLYKPLMVAHAAGDRTVWGGLVPDFSLEKARDLFAEAQQQETASLGVSGYKLDEDDGSDYTGSWFFPDNTHFLSGKTGAQLHNVFGFLYQKTIQEMYEGKDQRTFLLSRAGYTGSQAYPVAAYSDFYGFPEYLRALCNSGFTGVLWCPEVRNTPSDAEFIRRTELAFFSPVAMINAWDNGVTPWEKGPEVEKIFRRYAELRMRLIPYLYNSFWKDHLTGVPIVRPLIMDYQGDPAALSLDDEFLLGDSLLVAPVLVGESRTVYLPAGRWIDFWTDHVVSGGRSFTVQAPLDTVPLYVKEGSILPMGPPAGHVHEDQTISLSLYPGANTSTVVYNDDGITTHYLRGERAEMRLAAEWTKKGILQVRIGSVEGGYQWQQPCLDLEIHGLASAPSGVRLGTHSLPAFESQAPSGETVPSSGTLPTVSPAGEHLPLPGTPTASTGQESAATGDQVSGWSYDTTSHLLHLRVPFGRRQVVKVEGMKLRR